MAAVIGRVPVPPAERELFILACLRDLDFGVRRAGLLILFENPDTDPGILAELRNALLDLTLDRPRDARFAYYYTAWQGTYRAGLPVFYGLVPVIQALGRTGENAWETVPLLREICRKGDPEPRLQAGVAIWRIVGEDTELRTALTNSLALKGSGATRMFVIQTLKALTPEWPGVVDFWPMALHDDDKQIRYQSVLGLKEFGKEVRWILAHLRSLTNDHSVSVRDEASKAIVRIE